MYIGISLILKVYDKKKITQKENKSEFINSNICFLYNNHNNEDDNFNHDQSRYK